MKNKRVGLSALAVIGVAALALTGCSSNGGGSNGGGSGKSDASAVISTNGSEPQKPLVPSNTTETGGGKIIDSIFAGLRTYDAKGKPVNDIAKSIETSDSQNYDITIKSGKTFTDGEKVTAESFTKAWNWAAQKSNAQSGSYFFDDIEGFSYDKDSELTGLKVKSDTEFTVKLASPEADWPLRLGYSAFMPLPAKFYDDPTAFGQDPISNGPYKLAKKSDWTHNQQIQLTVNKDYEGPRKPKNGGLLIKFYTDLATAYSDAQAGNLDIDDTVSDNAFQTYKDDFPDRWVNQPAAIFQSMDIPYYLGSHWTGEEGKLRRAAISMSINRKQITDKIFNGTRTPAKDFTSPVIAGYSEDLKGSDVLNYNKSKAKELWAEADKMSKYNDTFTIAYNADGGHEAWVTATANSISNTLGIKAEGKPYATFQEALDARSQDKLDGASRAGWQADYPSLYNFLAPIYQTGAGSNYGRYSSEKFDTLLKEGAAADNTTDANKKFQEAQEVLFQDLPAIPLWYSNETGVWSDQVSNVTFGWNSVPLYYAVTKSAS